MVVLSMCYNLVAMNQNIEEVYRRLENNKKEIREINKMIRDQMVHIERHKEIIEEMKALREEKKSLENSIKADSQTEIDRLDDLKIEVSTDRELLADLALNKFLANESVEIVDEYDNRWVPFFSVTFKKE